ncbi:hypothetical protein KI387_041344, partial [Taxus chinensis]
VLNCQFLDNSCIIQPAMPRLTRAQKDARKAKQEALKASQNSNDDLNTTTSQAVASQQDSALHSNACGSSSQVIPAGESQQDSTLHCNACGSSSHIIPAGESQALTAGGNNVAEPVVENSIAEAIQVERAEKCSARTTKDGTSVVQRGPPNESREESVSLHPSQLETRQKQRVAGSSPAGNKGFSEGRNSGFNGRNSGQFQGCTGEDSRRGGGQEGSFQSVGRGRGGSYGYLSQGGSYGPDCYRRQGVSYGHDGYRSQGARDDNRRIDALGRALSSVLRHKAVGLGLKVRSDGYVAVKDLLSLSTKTLVGLPLHSHSVDDLKEVNRQFFSQMVIRNVISVAVFLKCPGCLGLSQRAEDMSVEHYINH